MKGDLITQMFEEMGIKVVDVTPKAKDWQITGNIQEGELIVQSSLKLETDKHGKKIPIEVWEEIDSYLPTGSLCYGNSTFDNKGGTSYYQGEICNQGGKTYLVTIKE